MQKINKKRAENNIKTSTHGYYHRAAMIMNCVIRQDKQEAEEGEI
jgi:hypothetical protein